MAVVAAIVLGLIVLLLGLALIRSLYLSVRAGAFPAWLSTPSRPDYRKGTAVYGQDKLGWFPPFGWKFVPQVVLPRRSLEIENVEFSAASETTVLTVNAPAGAYRIAVLQGNAQGLISWIGSAPPKETEINDR